MLAKNNNESELCWRCCESLESLENNNDQLYSSIVTSPHLTSHFHSIIPTTSTLPGQRQPGRPQTFTRVFRRSEVDWSGVEWPEYFNFSRNHSYWPLVPGTAVSPSWEFLQRHEIDSFRHQSPSPPSQAGLLRVENLRLIY